MIRTKPTVALYVDWGLPRKIRGVYGKSKKAWEVVMIARSTFYSKNVNGLSPILYCDPETYLYYKESGLSDCFDEIRVKLPSEISFDASVFWAAGKFLAILDISENFVMIDLDAEIRFPINFDSADVFCAHIEKINDNDLVHYPNPAYIREKCLSEKHGILWGDFAYNTCILYFGDLSIAKEYAQSALDFCESVEIDTAYEKSYILLAEQRFLYEFSKIKNLEVKTLISGYYQTADHSRRIPPGFIESDVNEIGKMGFIHIWGFKNSSDGTGEREMKLLSDLTTTSPIEKKDFLRYLKGNRIINEKEKLNNLKVKK